MSNEENTDKRFTLNVHPNIIGAGLLLMSVGTMLAPLYSMQANVNWDTFMCSILFVIGIVYCWSEQIKGLWGSQYEDPEEKRDSKKDDFN